MNIERLPPIVTSLQPSNHPYLNGAWTPLHEEVDADDLEVIAGALPTDIDGVYLRNTENQIHQPLGRYHPFDGDGMICQIDFHGGRASYRNRFVRTRGFAAEQESGGSLWGGLADPPSLARRPGFGAHGALKDSSSTDVVVHAGRGLSTFYQCGEGYRFDPLTLETQGVEGWVPIDGISAHAKVDEATGELMFFNYSKHAPFMHYGLVDAGNRLVAYQPIPLPGPRLPHDMAFTEHYAVLNDLPMFWDAELLKRNIHAVRLHEGLASRFAILPRRGGEARWFEAAPTYVLHWLNAYEEGEEVVLDGYFQEEPMPPPRADAPAGFGAMMAYLDEASFRPKLHRWRFNLRDGSTREERLDDRTMEFGVINPRHAGRPYRYAWSTVSKPGWFLFTGWIKNDLITGESWAYDLGPGRYGSEAPFAARRDGSGEEDDGYLVSFVTDENTGRSECILLDAARIQDGPVCRVALPHKLCSGTHAFWAEREQVTGVAAAPRG